MNVFVPKNGLHIDRSFMPQIQSADMPEFIRFLHKHGVKVKHTNIPVSKLIPTQGNINKEKVSALMSSKKEHLKKPVLVSSDHYIIDGHHRWLALLNMDDTETIPTYTADIKVQDLLSMARNFPKSFTKTIREFTEFVKEEKENHAVLAFGRMNPPTTGHAKLVDKVKEIANQVGGSHHIVISHSHDPKKNPLTAAQKLKHAKRYFPGTNITTSSKERPNFLDQAKELHKKGVTHLHMVAGSDRIGEYKKTLEKYNGAGEGKLFNFKKITVHSAGERDPDAEGTEGMSASKMRGHAKEGNFAEFRKGIPQHVSDKHAKELYHDVRKGMGLHEGFSLSEEVIEEGVHDKAIFKAVFLGGGPGSGKDYVLSKTLDGHGLVEINSDKAFEYLLDKHNMDKKMPDSEKEQRDIIRGRAKSMTELKERLAIQGRNGLIINGTGDDVEKTKKMKKMLEDLGYETKMIVVNTRDDVSQQRNVERGQRGGRTVPEDIRKEKWDAVQKARPEYAKIFGKDYHEFENSEDLRVAPDNVKDAKNKELDSIFKEVKKFISKPSKNDLSKEWISKELNKSSVNIPKTTKPQSHPQGSKAAEKAKQMGLDYFGFGRYGKNGKVTYHSVHDSLVPVEKTMKENIDSMFEKFLEEKNDPCWKNYKQLGMKMKNGKKVPNCIPVKEENKENVQESNGMDFWKDALEKNSGRTESGDSTASDSGRVASGSGTIREETRKKISLTEIKKKYQTKLTEMQDDEPGGRAMNSYSKEKIGKDGKVSMTELTGDETTKDIADQKEDELKKNGINILSFKAKNPI